MNNTLKIALATIGLAGLGIFIYQKWFSLDFKFISSDNLLKLVEYEVEGKKHFYDHNKPHSITTKDNKVIRFLRVSETEVQINYEEIDGTVIKKLKTVSFKF